MVSMTRILLNVSAMTKPLTESEQADYVERAAILEFEAGNTRDEAERLALAMVLDYRTRVPEGQRGEA